MKPNQTNHEKQGPFIEETKS